MRGRRPREQVSVVLGFDGKGGDFIMPPLMKEIESDPYQSPKGEGRDRHTALLKAALPIPAGEAVIVKNGVVINLTRERIGKPAQPVLES